MNTKPDGRRLLLARLGLFLGVTLLGAWGTVAQAATPQKSGVVGLWRVIDDNSHKPISLIAVREDQGVYMGTVMRVMNSSKGDHPICDACTGDRKGKAVVGMTVLWDLKPGTEANTLTEGFVLDPAKGKIYRAKIKLLSQDRLELRGYLGISLFGRTQTWERAKPSDLTDPIVDDKKRP